ncbi:MAG: LLM class flavin-dependent oxidoreductase, partial [Alphaproteobacteria bacterium]|nr:LLM class flavin-dependent oxidoreductase [Alphaproteobacteria bacterium]
VLASAVAPQFEHIKPLVAVHPGLWDPVMTAKLAVSLDRICKKPMAINIVNGWFDEEFKMFGGTVLQGEERYRRTTEFIAIMRGLWQNESFSFDGEHYKLDKGQLLLKPRSPAPPEIYSVSRSDRGRRFIAEECDWWFIEFPKDAEDTADLMRQIEASIDDMNARTRATGRKVRYALNPFFALAASEEQALEETVSSIFKYDPNTDQRKLQQRMMPALKAGCIGTPDAVRKQVQRFADLGIELVLCKMIATTDNMQKIAAEIIAPMRGGGGYSQAAE